jgi:methylthioribose-1-phosphate isomerase
LKGIVDFFTERTVRWDNGTVVLIDQRRLPNRFTYITCTDHTQIAKTIRDMNVRGAPAIGVAAAMGLALTAHNSKAGTKHELLGELEEAGKELVETRPTAANLAWGVKRILLKASEAEGDIGHLKQTIIEEAERMGDEDVEINREIGRNGSPLLKDGDTVLTHCKWL